MHMDVILAAAMTAAFVTFAVTLLWADLRTHYLDDRA